MTRRQIRVHPLSGGVEVLGAAVSAEVVKPAGAPVAAETTLPMTPLTPGALRWLAFFYRARTLWRATPVAAKVALVALLAAVVVLVLRDSSSTGASSSAAAARVSTTTSSSASSSRPPSAPTAAAEDPAAVVPRRPSPEKLHALPVAVVGEAIPQAPADPAPAVDPGTTVLHPTEPAAVYLEPGGDVFARLPVHQVISPTWVPVVARQPGWAMVLLPSRPHPGGIGPVGWIYLDNHVELGRVDRRVEIDRGAGTVSVLTELGRVTTTSGIVAAATSAGRRSFVAIGVRASGTVWPFIVWWPLLVDTDRVCSTLLGGISVPGLPERSPLGGVDGKGCVTTPVALRDHLADIPSGATVLLR